MNYGALSLSEIVCYGGYYLRVYKESWGISPPARIAYKEKTQAKRAKAGKALSRWPVGNLFSVVKDYLITRFVVARPSAVGRLWLFFISLPIRINPNVSRYGISTDCHLE